MKWIVFAVAAAAALPAGRLARGHPRALAALCFLIGLLPWVMPDRLGVNFLSEELYRGDARGLEVTIVDLVAAAAWMALPKAKHPPPYRIARWAYLAVAAVSIALAEIPLYATFSVWNVVRAYFVMAIVARACEQRQLAPWILRGLGAGVIYALTQALMQRYLHGVFRAQADFGHPNTLGMATNLVAPLALSLLLAGQGGKIAWGTVLSGAVNVVLTLSRGAMAMFAFVSVITYGGSLVRRLSARKMWVALAGLLAGSVVLAYSIDTIIERFTTAPDASGEARERFEAAAADMLEDHPFGIGMNQFSYVLDNGGYADRQDIPEIDRTGLAHHIYWLTAAELGYLGVLAYLLVLLHPWWVAVRAAWRTRAGRRYDVRGDVLLGAAAGLTVFYAQGLFEWAARQTPLMYLFFIVAGLVAPLARQAEGSDE